MMSVDSSSMVVTVFNDLDVAELLLSVCLDPPYIGWTTFWSMFWDLGSEKHEGV